MASTTATPVTTRTFGIVGGQKYSYDYVVLANTVILCSNLIFIIKTVVTVRRCIIIKYKVLAVYVLKLIF